MTTRLGLLSTLGGLSGCLGLQIDFAGDYSTYSVSHAGSILFKAERGIAVFVDGAWQSQSAGSLKLQAHKAVSGSDPALGAYKGTELSWTAGASTPFVTTAKTYASGLDVAFEYAFPSGAKATSLVEHLNKTRDEVIANFPAFTTAALPDALSWSGSFVQSDDKRTTGPAGGPTVFFDKGDASLATVVVGSALDNFKASSAGPGTTWDGAEAWVPGTAGTIEALDAGFKHTFVLHAARRGGITAAVAEWGELLQRAHKAYKLTDVTLTNIGYQTDNGAMYVFCRGNCSKTLLDELAELKAAGVPMGYLSFQGAGASSVDAAPALAPPASISGGGGGGGGGGDPPHAAPWCVNTWGPDLDGNGAYPMPLKQFQQALGVPLQLYAPYFCPGSEYFSRNNASSPWTSVVSDTTLDGCGSYGFQDVEPAQSRQFYDWFFAKGQDVGMVSFEPDFMNQNYNCVPEFVRSATAANTWQQGMAGAALAKNLTVQWCYATPTDVLASLDMPAVTNFRVSFDFCYGGSYKIGTSSLLVWALGAFPSKDTLWTTDNNRTAVPGCPWTADHEAVAAPLHVVLALMSMGPVGISDALGLTDAELIKRTIAADGTLLKPSKSVTSVDSAIAGAEGKPDGSVYGTYSGSGTDAVDAHQFVSFQLKSEFGVLASDFYPPLGASASALVHREFGNGKGCANGTDASACVAQTTAAATPVVTLPKSDFSNTTGGTDFAPAVTTVWPVCAASGWALLGELTKYVPLSPQRFSGIDCSAAGVTATVTGTAGEVVPVTLLQPSGSTAAATVLVVDVTLPASGVQKISFP